MITVHRWNGSRCERTGIEGMPESAAGVTGDEFVWINLSAPTPEEEAAVFQKFLPVHPLTLEDVTRIRREPDQGALPEGGRVPGLPVRDRQPASARPHRAGDVGGQADRGDRETAVRVADAPPAPAAVERGAVAQRTHHALDGTARVRGDRAPVPRTARRVRPARPGLRVPHRPRRDGGRVRARGRVGREPARQTGVAHLHAPDGQTHLRHPETQARRHRDAQDAHHRAARCCRG